MSQYPTIDQVEAADLEQLCRWRRFLPGTGMSAAGTDSFQSLLEKEVEIISRICARITELGGMTPAISKRIGWEA